MRNLEPEHAFQIPDSQFQIQIPRTRRSDEAFPLRSGSPDALRPGSLYVFLDRLGPYLRAVDVALRVDRDTFGGARPGRVLFRVRDEVLDGQIFRAADAHPSLPASRVRRLARLRVGTVQHVVLVDVNPAQAAEGLRLGDEFAVLIEDLQPHVAAVRDEQAPARIERQAVRGAELTGCGAELSERLAELAVPGELRNARDRVGRGIVVLTGVSFRD